MRLRTNRDTLISGMADGQAQAPRYTCLCREPASFPSPDASVWDHLPVMRLADVETGAAPRLRTEVKVFISYRQQAIFVGFWGEDDGVHSAFQKRDDPIYQQDALELFLCSAQPLNRYAELMVSPNNVQYDADITYHDAARIDVDVSWDFAGWRTLTQYTAQHKRLVSVWSLPFSGFKTPPKPRDMWRFNVFRIDHDGQGEALTAWIPTGQREFHVPQRFGFLVFAPV